LSGLFCFIPAAPIAPEGNGKYIHHKGDRTMRKTHTESNDINTIIQPQHSGTPRSWAKNVICLTVLALTVAAAGTVHATDGYFSNGYGIKSKGRAGVSLTATDDAFGGANNPATIVWAADRVDVGVDYFRPKRESERSGAAGPASALNGQVNSDSDNFFIPELGLKYSISDTFAVGIAVYGNGGMNTNYAADTLNFGPGGTKNILAGTGRLGVDLNQLLVAPTVAWKFTPNQSIGLAPQIGYQWFKASGLDAFSGSSQAPAALSDHGYDKAFGIGVRVGYLWNVSPEFSVGAAYSSPVFMQRFDTYRGLFAKDGGFDIPQNVGVGVGVQPLPSLRLGVDYQWIDYAGVASVGNPSNKANPLGSGDGPGFGWRSISAVKVGADWKAFESLTLRAGYSFNENPIRSSDVTFNILAPGVIQHHLTLGTTYAFGSQELSAAYMHGFLNSVSGDSLFVAFGKASPGTVEKISMSQDSFGLQYSYKF
jgi:long-chain fatty acid transport protein